MSRKQLQSSIAGKILQKLDELGAGMLDAFFPYKYPETRMWRKILGLDPSYQFSRKNFSAHLSGLRQQGLVERIGSKKRALWKITIKGKNALRRKKDEYAPKKDGVQRLVTFDIPEKERSKRIWIRAELITFGYKPLQKSVWIGDVPLPNDFVETLDARGLVGKVHMFSIREKGTLKTLEE